MLTLKVTLLIQIFDTEKSSWKSEYRQFWNICIPPFQKMLQFFSLISDGLGGVYEVDWMNKRIIIYLASN